MCLCFVCWGERAWTGAVVLAAVVVAVLAPAVVVAVLAPAVAADLLAVALIGFASFAFALSLRSSPLPSGSPTTAGYPLHTFVYGVGWHPVDLGGGACAAGLRVVAGAAHHRCPLRAGPP
jgi:hypothetical protein